MPLVEAWHDRPYFMGTSGDPKGPRQSGERHSGSREQPTQLHSCRLVRPGALLMIEEQIEKHLSYLLLHQGQLDASWELESALFSLPGR